MRLAGVHGNALGPTSCLRKVVDHWRLGALQLVPTEEVLSLHVHLVRFEQSAQSSMIIKIVLGNTMDATKSKA